MGTLSLKQLEDVVGGGSVETGKFHYLINGSAKLWFNLDGTGTIAGRDDINVASFDDNGTGHYDANFTNNMNAGDYALCHTNNNDNGLDLDRNSGVATSSYLTSSMTCRCGDSTDIGGLPFNADTVCYHLYGDLA